MTWNVFLLSFSLFRLHSTQQCSSHQFTSGESRIKDVFLPYSGFQKNIGQSVNRQLLSLTRWPNSKCVYLKAAYNLPQRQRAFAAADESGGGQPEHFVQVGLRQPVETWWNGRGAAANKRRQAQPGQSSRGGKGRVQKHRTGQSQIFTKICRPKILQHEKHTTWKGEQDIFF